MPSSTEHSQRQRSLSADTVTMQTQMQTKTESQVQQTQPQPQSLVAIGTHPVCCHGRLTASNLELHNSLVYAQPQCGLDILPTPPATSSGVGQSTVPVEQCGLNILPTSTSPAPAPGPAITSSVEHGNERVNSYYSTLALDHREIGSWESQVHSDGSLLPGTRLIPGALDGTDFLCDIHCVHHLSNGNESLTLDLDTLAKEVESAKLSDDRDACLECPLQRFLTPRMADTPTFYTRPAMQMMMTGVHDGILDGVQTKGRAERNMAVAAKNRDQAGQSAVSLDVQGECEYLAKYDA